MDVAEVIPLHLELELSEGFDKRHALYVPYGASQLLTQNNCLDHKNSCMNTQVEDCPSLTLLSDGLKKNMVLSGACGP